MLKAWAQEDVAKRNDIGAGVMALPAIAARPVACFVAAK